jgi:excinuclease ABC subunit C
VIRNREGIPEKNGVYLFKNRDDRVLYIGKAKNLKKRIEQYFQRKYQATINTLLRESHQIDYILTDNESDALHLEYNLIHHYQPVFNIRLKDDKGFPFIEVTAHEDFPGIYYTRDLSPNNLSIGPIADAKKTKVIIDMITRIFKLRTCSDISFKKKIACLYYYIDRCSAPCIKKITRQEYHQNTRDAIRFLKGNKSSVLKKLQQEMKGKAKELEFEKAQQIKEEIQMINEFNLESYISSLQEFDYDVIALHNRGDEAMLILFSIIQGKVKQREYISFNHLARRQPDILRTFLISHYQTHNLPGEILVPFLPADARNMNQLFSEIARKKVIIKVPLKGKKKKLLDLAIKNLNEYEKRNEYPLIADRLRKALSLTRIPNHIEGFDISHMSERERVGAVVVFKNGKPVKSLYRNYLIGEAGAGDIEALKEVLERRFKNRKTNPDLLLIDGGLPQLNIARDVKHHMDMKFDIVALAKREERIFLENGQSMLFPPDSPEKFLFQNIRDEVHRRAIQHHRKRREKLPDKLFDSKK